MFKRYLLLTLLVLPVFLSSFIIQTSLEEKFVYSTYSIKSFDGTTIFFETIKHAKSSWNSSLVILLHGFSMNKNSMKLLALSLASKGFICVLVDLRGHGDSYGSLQSANITKIVALLAKDVLEIASFLKSRGIGSTKNISIIGHSLGGALAIYLGYMYSETFPITVAISPAPLNNFIDLIKPKHLYVIGSYSDKVVTWREVFKLFSKAVPGDVTVGKEYSYNGSTRTLFMDRDATHISIIYDRDVINFILSQLKKFAIGGKEIVPAFNPEIFLLTVFISFISLLLMILLITPILIFSWRFKASRLEVYPASLDYMLRIFIESIIVAGTLGAIVATIVIALSSIIFPTTIANFFYGILLGNSVSLTMVSKRYLVRYYDKSVETVSYLKEVFLKDLSGNSIRITLIYSALILLTIYSTISQYFVPILTRNTLKLSLIPIYFVLYLAVFTQDEAFFRYFLRKGLGYGAKNYSISLLLTISIKFISILIQLLFISAIFRLSFYFLANGLILAFPFYIACILLSETLFEETSTYTPQILINSLIFSLFTVSTSPILLGGFFG